MKRVRIIRYVTEREIALTLVLLLAQYDAATHYGYEFSLKGFYDNDIDFLDDLHQTLQINECNASYAKINSVVRRLVNYGVLQASTRSTHKAYIGEPTHQRNYRFARRGKAHLLTAGEIPGIRGTPEWEAEFLLRHAYPKES